MKKEVPPPTVRVRCTRRDCIHFHDDTQATPRQQGMCQCAHPDKVHHMDQIPCPLYRLDWRQASSMSLEDW